MFYLNSLVDYCMYGVKDRIELLTLQQLQLGVFEILRTFVFVIIFVCVATLFITFICGVVLIIHIIAFNFSKKYNLSVHKRCARSRLIEKIENRDDSKFDDDDWFNCELKKEMKLFCNESFFRKYIFKWPTPMIPEIEKNKND